MSSVAPTSEIPEYYSSFDFRLRGFMFSKAPSPYELTANRFSGV